MGKKSFRLWLAVSLALFASAAICAFLGRRSHQPREYPAPQNVPAGWRVVKDYALGIQYVIPTFLELDGCRQRVGSMSVNGQIYLGTLWDPCRKIMNVNAGDEKYSDMFSGYQIIVLKNVDSEGEAAAEFGKAWGVNCKIFFSDLRKGIFEIFDAKERVNEWAPRSCGDYTDHPEAVHGFYNSRTKMFFIWSSPPQEFPTGGGEFADARIQIMPL